MLIKIAWIPQKSLFRLMYELKAAISKDNNKIKKTHLKGIKVIKKIQLQGSKVSKETQ